MDLATVGSSDIAIKIGDFITENKSFRRRMLRRLNSFNALVKDVVNSVDLRADTKMKLFNRIYQDARHNANELAFATSTGSSSNEYSRSYPAYLLITYFKTVWDETMPFLRMLKEEDRLWNDAPVGSDKKKVLGTIRESDTYANIQAFIEKKVQELKKY